MGREELLVLTWDDLFWDVYELARIIEKSGYKADLLVVIARGGWVVGRILSDLLSLKSVAGITIKSYEGINVKKTPKVTQGIDTSLKGKSVLLVDDIVDSGETLETALRYLRTKEISIVKSAVPYVKPKASIKPDYYVKIIDKWVVFPYEYKETLELLNPDSEIAKTIVETAKFNSLS